MHACVEVCVGVCGVCVCVCVCGCGWVRCGCGCVGVYIAVLGEYAYLEWQANIS